MTVFILSSIIYLFIGVLMNWERGGGLFDGNTLMKKYLKISLRNVILVGCLYLPVITFSYLLLNGVTAFDAGIIILAQTLGYLIAFVPGWGSYFDVGSWTHEFIGHREIGWIDWILFKRYGPLWVPDALKNAVGVKMYYDLVVSPTGGIRPYEWRRVRDRFGMCLRGLYFIPMFIFIAIAREYVQDIATWKMIVISLLGFAMYAMGYIYDAVTSETPKPNQYPSEQGWGELITGGYLTLLMVIAFFI